MNKIKFISLVVVVAAMVFTFSCSSDDGENEVGGSSSSVGNGGDLSSSDGGTPAITTFVDDRDNKTYKKVTIGTQTWMAENLNYAGEAGNEIGSCYHNNPANCVTYGRLYDWETANTVCPSGWYLPSNTEWTTLRNFVESDSECSSCAGTKLKSASGWNSGGNGTDDYDFSALPGGRGYSDGNFDSVVDFGSWWSTTEASMSSEPPAGSGDPPEVSYVPYYWYMSNNSNYVYRDFNKHELCSVRCVKDN